MAGGILGLDLAKCTGLAHVGPVQPDGLHRCATRTIDLNPRGGIRGVHYFSFQKQFDDVLRRLEPDGVVFEDVEFAKYRLAYAVFCRLSVLVMVRSEAFAIPYTSVPTSTLKLYAGKGNASKNKMRRFAEQKLFGVHLVHPRPEPGPDEIDAIWAAWWGTCEATW